MLCCKDVQIIQGDFSLRADLCFASEKITALIGPSGAGKSTLLSVLGGFLTPDHGRVIHDGVDITDLPPGQRPISILFQDNNLFPHLTVAQNVGLALQPRLKLSATERDSVMQVLAKVGLEGLENRRPAALSGGQQSRAALARVLLADRPVVLLDEPFAALGPGLKDEMLDLVRETVLGAGRTVIMVTHNPADAKRIASETVLIADGVAAAPVATADLFASPPPALASYLGPQG